MSTIETIARPVVRSAVAAEEAEVLNVITLAFGGDPVVRWAIPDAAHYLAFMPQFARAFGGNGFAQGTVYRDEDCCGAAMWLPPGTEPDADTMLGLIEQNTRPDRLDDMLGVLEQMEQYHPHEPHWYLPLIGVDPSRYGQGLGTALMRHALARCDQDGLPAYLESSNPRNLSLYRRQGFEERGTIQAGSSPPVVPMVRWPR
jgi:ribosomal protein S18 acetylase RimI-like enzyme